MAVPVLGSISNTSIWILKYVFKIHIRILYFVFEIHFENVICICISNTCWCICILFFEQKIQNTFWCRIYFFNEQPPRQLSPLSWLLPASKFWQLQIYLCARPYTCIITASTVDTIINDVLITAPNDRSRPIDLGIVWVIMSLVGLQGPVVLYVNWQSLIHHEW